MKINKPPFLKLQCIRWKGQDDKTAMSYVLRVDPLTITSYFEYVKVTIGESEVEATLFIASGQQYIACMSVEEFDVMIEDINRNIEVNDTP